jgi:predicted  nucleic acid-binding Zn-ribbon protein
MMYGHRCLRCGHYWASQANPDQYACITRFCPDCVAKYIPVQYSPLIRSA